MSCGMPAACASFPLTASKFRHREGLLVAATYKNRQNTPKGHVRAVPWYMHVKFEVRTLALTVCMALAVPGISIQQPKI